MDEDTPKRDPKKLILDEFRSGKPIFESYNKFCKTMGPKFLDYPEFEFWWMRFSAGNFDINYDRSQDPKYRTIEDIPVHIFEKICGNLEDDDENNYWFTLRHVSKSFRNIVDSWTPPKITNIEISLYKGVLLLRFDKFGFSYTEKSENLSEVGPRFQLKILHSGNYRDLAVEDLTKVLAVPGGFKLENLRVDGEIDSIFAQKIFEKFENLGTKIHVDTVEIHPDNIDPVAVDNILNLCQSIKTIDIRSKDLPDEEFTDKIKGITSLRNAEMVTIHKPPYGDKFWDPSSLDIPRMTLEAGSTVSGFLKIFKSLLESPHLEYCHVIGYVRQSLALQKGLKKCGVEVHPRNPEIYSWSIPNSDEIFEIKFIRENRYRPIKTIAFTDIHITRKSKFARFLN